MKKKITIEEITRIQSEYNSICESLANICNTIRKIAKRSKKELPRIDEGSAWIFRHGVVDTDATWEIIPKDDKYFEETIIKVPAWDGYDGELYNNSSVNIPLDFLNMSNDELVKLLESENSKEAT